MLDLSIVNEIQKFINEKLHEDKISALYPNRVLRDDVLSLLAEYCTVVFFPIEDETNNGFHALYQGRPSKEAHFVFINTAQTLEKQVFTASHELGHIWKVDEQICDKYKLTSSKDLKEQIVNRFAAELLMPEEQFRDAAIEKCNRYITPAHEITLDNLIRVVADLMNIFFAPSTSVFLRLAETNILKHSMADAIIDGKSIIPTDILYAKLKQCYIENGYTKFIDPDRKKWINGLPELLDLAEKNESISKEKIDQLRNQFEIKSTIPTEENSNVITLNR